MSTQAGPAATDAQAFLKELRTLTAPAHEALEAHPLSQSITKPGLSRQDYIRYLQVMQRMVTSTEATLHPLLRDVLPDIAAREKSAWLKKDLAALGAAANPYPPFAVPKSSDIAYSLGAYYVLEGSTLGGRVILKSLPEGLKASGATSYFEGYGAETGAMWKGFQEVITSCAAATPANAAAIISGAEDTFAAIRNFFSTCAAHDASGHR